jgi:hypothetical protein
MTGGGQSFEKMIGITDPLLWIEIEASEGVEWVTIDGGVEVAAVVTFVDDEGAP